MEAHAMRSLGRSDSSTYIAGSAATCRLCWDPEGAGPDGLLLSPCRCKGSCAFIHRGCLQRWLDTRPRGACDVCRSPYDVSLLADVGIRLPPLDLPDHQSSTLIPARLWLQLNSQGHAPGAGAGAHAAHATHEHPWPAAHAHRRAAAARRHPRWWARHPARDALFFAGLLHSCWRALVAADGCLATLALLQRRCAPAGVRWPWGRGHARVVLMLPCSTGEDVRASFDVTTIWQVKLYSAIVALTPSSGASEACSGMALGAIIGGCLSSITFLPLAGISRLDALAGCVRLAARAGVRLAAGLACRPSAHRRLAGALMRLGRPLAWVKGRLGGRRRRQQRQEGQRQWQWQEEAYV